MTTLRTFFRDYGRVVFWHWDARLGYVTVVASMILLIVSSVARSRLDALATSGVTVAALGLTFALTSLSLLSAVIEPLVEVLDGLERRHGNRKYGLHGLTTAFRSVSVLGAVAVALWLLVRAVAVPELRGNGWDAAQVVLGGLAAGSTAWLLGALVGLVQTVSVLVSGKAELIRQRERTGRAQSGERNAS